MGEKYGRKTHGDTIPRKPHPRDSQLETKGGDHGIDAKIVPRNMSDEKR